METVTCTKIRYGRRYHVLFVYEDEKEVRRQLETYNWKHMADLADSPKLTDEDRKSYDYHKVRQSPPICPPRQHLASN